MNTRIFLITGSFLLLCLPIARADDQTELNRAVDSINQHSATTDRERRVLRSIAIETGVPPATLRAQKEATGYGNGELLIANLLARASDRTFDDVAAMRKTEGWGKMAHDLGFNLGQLVSRAHRAEQAAAHAQNTGHAHQFNGQQGHGKAHGKGRR